MSIWWGIWTVRINKCTTNCNWNEANKWRMWNLVTFAVIRNQLHVAVISKTYVRSCNLTFRLFVQPLLQWKNNEYYINLMCGWPCIVIQCGYEKPTRCHFLYLYFSSNSCSTCFGQPCAHHQELTTAWCYSLGLVCAVVSGRWSSPVGSRCHFLYSLFLF